MSFLDDDAGYRLWVLGHPDGGQVTLARDKGLFPVLPSASVISRFTLTTSDGARAVYIGETDNLARRMGNYGDPGPAWPTNERMSARIADTLTVGCAVDLGVLLHAEVDGGPLSPASRSGRTTAPRPGQTSRFHRLARLE